jgi:hypothetical protein
MGWYTDYFIALSLTNTQKITQITNSFNELKDLSNKLSDKQLQNHPHSLKKIITIIEQQLNYEFDSWMWMGIANLCISEDIKIDHEYLQWNISDMFPLKDTKNILITTTIKYYDPPQLQFFAALMKKLFGHDIAYMHCHVTGECGYSCGQLQDWPVEDKYVIFDCNKYVLMLQRKYRKRKCVEMLKKYLYKGPISIVAAYF